MKSVNRNMYFTTVISILLVLFLVGAECIVLLSAHNVVNRIKENVSVELTLKDNTDSAEVARIQNLLEIAPFCKSYQYISKDEALQEHIAYLGEDPTKFLGYNPLRASIEVHLVAAYAVPDSIASVQRKLSVFSSIEKITYEQGVVQMVDSNVNYLSIALLIAAAILLFISLLLISNTVELQIYSRRFLIHTMKLVGATPWVIKGPIVKRCVGLGLIAAMLSLMLLAGAVYYVQYSLGVMLMPLTVFNISLVCGIVLLTSVVITFFSSLVATGRYIRMDVDDLYFM